MTEIEIKEKISVISQNPLYKNSISPFKEFQFLQFLEKGNILMGEKVKTFKINNTDTPVIFRFNKNGLLESNGTLPAIEYLGHWEHWKNGLIKKVFDTKQRLIETWEDGLPISYEPL